MMFIGILIIIELAMIIWVLSDTWGKHNETITESRKQSKLLRDIVAQLEKRTYRS